MPKNPVTTIIDVDASIWVSNGDGTFRCLSAEIEHMTLEQIESEFGPLVIYGDLENGR